MARRISRCIRHYRGSHDEYRDRAQRWVGGLEAALNEMRELEEEQPELVEIPQDPPDDGDDDDDVGSGVFDINDFNILIDCMSGASVWSSNPSNCYCSGRPVR